MSSSNENKKIVKETIIQVIKKFTGNEKVVLAGQIKEISELNYKVQKKNGEIVKGKLENVLFPEKNFYYAFNEKGFKIEEKTFSTNGIDTREVFDDTGKLIELYSYDEKGDLRIKGIYTNNNDGNCIENYVCDGEDKYLFSNTSKYDNRGNQIEYESKSKHEDSNFKQTSIYDENNFRIEYSSFNAKGDIASRNTIKYDMKGNNIEEKVFLADGRLANTFITNYNYDAEGNVIHPLRVIPPHGFHPFHKYEYEYDHHNNWIKKITFYNKIPVSISVREINYFDEIQKNISVAIQPQNKTKKSIENKKKNNMDNKREIAPDEVSNETELDLDSAKWIAELSKPEDFSVFRYYVVLNKNLPSEKVFLEQNIDALALKTELEENMDAEVLHTYYSVSGEQNERLVRYTLGFPNNCYFVQAIQIQQKDADDYDVPDFVKDANDNDGTVNTSQLKLIHPSEVSGKRDAEFENLLDYYFGLCSLQKMPDRPEIYMVEVSNGSFYLKSHPVNDSFEIKNLDMNYGHGFEKFHNDLMNRFKTETKGLVLFHGEPGTGKTYYIRHLLRSMADNNKIVIYMPPNMVDHLVEPSFMTFISQQVTHYSQQGMFCVLLIEDAEPLLAARGADTRIQGVTNLLNMTDGLLNDMLSLQIICTFNVGLKKLDKALLRPGRLIARKEFKSMSALDANRLAQQLGLKHHFTAHANLSEVYSLVKDKNTLIHDVDEDGNSTAE